MTGDQQRRRLFDRWTFGAQLEPIDFAQRGVPPSAADLVRRDGLCAVGIPAGLIDRDSWVVPCRGHPCGSIEAAGDPRRFIAAAPILDLALFDPARPSEWRLMRGAVTVLGAIECQVMDPPPVRVHRDPLAWLAADGEGLCLLTDSPRERRSILSECRGGVAVSDPEFGRELAASIAAARPPEPAFFVVEA